MAEGIASKLARWSGLYHEMYLGGLGLGVTDVKYIDTNEGKQRRAVLTITTNPVTIKGDKGDPGRNGRDGQDYSGPDRPERPESPRRPEPSRDESTVSYNDLINTMHMLGRYQGEAGAFREIIYKENIKEYVKDIFKYALDSEGSIEEKLQMYKLGALIGTRAMLANASYKDAIDNGANPYETLVDFLGLGPDVADMMRNPEFVQYFNDAMRQRTENNTNQI